MRPEDEVRKKLDDVVGDYRPPRNWRLTALKWLGAAVLGVCASLLIVYILDNQITSAQKAPAPKRPVQVQIIPAK